MTDELTMVREVLGDVADRVSSRPPDRAQIDRGLRRVRRRRRVARAGKGLGALGALATCVAALQLGVVSLPAWVPAVPIGTSAASALAQRATSGSLAGDAAWLQTLREKVATFDRSESGGERWRAPSADAVDVLFAGDVGAFRIAIVETPLRWGAIGDRQQINYVGVRGAAVEAMIDGGNSSPEDLVLATFGGDNLPSDGNATQDAARRSVAPVAVLLGPSSLTVERVGPASVDAAGTVTWPATRVPATAPGTWEVVAAPAAPRTYLRWTGAEPAVVGNGGFVVATGAEWAALVAGATPALRTGSAPPRTVSSDVVPQRLAEAAAGAQYTSGLSLEGTSRRLLWTGTLDDTLVDLVEVTAPSGGRVVAAVQAQPPAVTGATDGYGGTPAAVTTLAAPSRQDGVAADAGLGLAWTFQGVERLPDGGWRTGGATRLALFAERAAARAEVTRDSGIVQLVDVPAGGPTVVTLEGARSVRFLDADGRVLSQVGVQTWDVPLDPWYGWNVLMPPKG